MARHPGAPPGAAASHALAAYYGYRARASRSGAARLVDRANDVCVSLTSHGQRLDFVHLTIESIGAGHYRPRRLILWLEEKDFDRGGTLLAHQVDRGLEIRQTPAFGPHSKYFSYATTMARDSESLVTADDDILYPRYWLASLVRASFGPRIVRCHRARTIVVKEGRISPYKEWPLVESSEPSVRHLATGVSGVLYSSDFLKAVRESGDSFTVIAPRADDLWLHAIALRNGFKVAQISKRPRHFAVTPGTEPFGLMLANIDQGANDHQIRSLYTEQDVTLLERQMGSLP